ncbi:MULTISPECIES: HlyD family efflux transporter periplasmic adaptor subunit [unclassified Moorena]|uniref:HlyD family secretion protein n=1 Tax=unclassified Moorena TaxID=2683338 RepID=UPI0013FFA046|nr:MULTISPECIES: HlyD family efflux transporter periplasmic adaptor subunit [unclassified Moorena]NEO15543.1 HlyD family efflux transporter periplasmic adaptor subunit [Moorena sp. SIO3E8]NEQ01956.1 HlyD family efflux transporter periplasmic adaptor subunit [Moorena sp. SIO3F7]
MISNYENQVLPPIQENEFLPPIGRWIQFGGLFIVATLALAIPIGSVTKYKETVKAQASFRPAGELRIVQAATEGQVMNISVEENQVVKKGDGLATIDDSRLQTKKSQLQSNIGQVQLQLVQIKAQISALNSQIQAETNRSNRAIASAKAELDHRRRDYRDRKITTVAEVSEAEAQLRQAQEQWHGAQARLKSTKANLRSTKAGLNAARSKRNRYQPIAEVGALSQDRFEEAQLVVQQQEQAVEAQKGLVEEQKQTIKQLQQGVKAALARLQRAKAALNPSSSEVAIASERIAQEKATGEATLARLNKEREALIQQRIEISKHLERDSRELKQVELDLSQTVITATADGIVSKLNLRNPGQTVRSGEEIAQIVPGDAPLKIKAVVSPSDIGKLAEGQKVHMRVSACPYPDYGTLKGLVSQISEDTIKPQSNGARASALSQKGRGASAFYEVTISPESHVLGKGKNQCSLQLGMEGRADIISREETVLRFLLRKARLVTDL